MNDSEVPAAGKQVIVTCAFIHHNFDGVEKIFMPKRAATKKFCQAYLNCLVLS